MADIAAIVEKQRKFFGRGRTKDITFRKKYLLKLQAWIKSHDLEIYAALKTDLNKPAFESEATEVGIVLDELKYALKGLNKWAKPKFVPTNLKNFPSIGKIYPDPYGVALVMSPWNYPFMLTMTPVVAALAAGNCVVVKPSAYAAATSSLIVKMCSEVFDPALVAVVEGGRKENQDLLNEQFDFIFFTGSIPVGQTVMEAASKYLTPVLLELGGKSPCIVDPTTDLRMTAKRIVWGKFLNAGQTCVAPDYLLVQESIKEALIPELKMYMKRLYGAKPCENPDYAKIVNEKHFNRVLGLMEGQKILMGGGSDAQTLKIEPTLLDEVSWDSPVMQEEIFGPVLPILTYSTVDEAAKLISARPKPLAAYIFTTLKATEHYFLKNLAFGGGCVNDVAVQLSVPGLPFGGVGSSGMGNYHGKAGFDAFTHYKSVLHKSTKLDIPLRYPPYSDTAMKILKKLR